MRLWLLCSWIFVSSLVFVEGAPPAELKSGFSKLTGSVTDDKGEPLAGVRVDISTAAPKVGQGIFCPSCYLDCGKWAKTNQLGEFAFNNLDPALKFRLVAAAPTYRASQTELIDPESGTVKISLAKIPTDIEPSRILTGIVKSHLGIPIEGALVEPLGAKTNTKRWYGRVDVDSTVTDHQGRFSMILPKEFLGMDVRVFADGYSAIQSDLLQPGAKVVELEMHEGARVTGKLVLAGKPVPNMSIAVVQVDRSTENGIFIKAVAGLTGDDGSFEFKHLPPNQKYAIFSVVGDAKRTKSDYVLATKTFSVGKPGQSRDLGKLTVSSPVTIRGKVVHTGGEPLSSNTKIMFGRDPAWDLISTQLNDDGTFEMTGLPPETYEISVVGRGLEIVSDKFPFQMLGPQSFGVHLTPTSDDVEISIPVKSQ